MYIFSNRHSVILSCHYSSGSPKLQQDSADSKLYISQIPLTFTLQKKNKKKSLWSAVNTSYYDAVCNVRGRQWDL